LCGSRTAIRVERLIPERVHLIPVGPAFELRRIAVGKAEPVLDESQRHGARQARYDIHLAGSCSDQRSRLVRHIGPNPGNVFAIENGLHDRFFAPMHGGIVLRHPIVALLRLVERDAEDVVPEQDVAAVRKSHRQRHLGRGENRASPAQLIEERQRLLRHPAAHERPAFGNRRRIKAVQIMRHGISDRAAGARSWPPARRPDDVVPKESSGIR
jgi:hypothetical protein